MTLNFSKISAASLAIALLASCSDGQNMTRLKQQDMEEEAMTAPEESPAPNPYAAQFPDNNMTFPPGPGQIVQFQKPYLHCGSAQTVRNPVAGFFGIGITAQQALARATAQCNESPSSFIQACERSRGVYNPAVNGPCVEMDPVQSDSIPVDLYNFGGGVYSDHISVCRVVYCSPRSEE